MKIQISEVWNLEGRSEMLAIIEAPRELAQTAVFNWVDKNRPDLNIAGTINAHGYHAIELRP